MMMRIHQRQFRKPSLSIVMLLLMALGACSSSERVENASANDARSSPHAVKLELIIHDETNADVLYRVERDGSIHWGGGMKARLDKTIWTGQMTEDERRQLHELLVQHQWFDRDPVSTNEPKGRRYEVNVSGTDGSNHFRAKGANAEIEPVANLLEKICLRRLEPELKALPQPGLQKR